MTQSTLEAAPEVAPAAPDVALPGWEQGLVRSKFLRFAAGAALFAIGFGRGGPASANHNSCPGSPPSGCGPSHQCGCCSSGGCCDSKCCARTGECTQWNNHGWLINQSGNCYVCADYWNDCNNQSTCSKCICKQFLHSGAC